jgi:hypothetical protein
MGVWKIMAMVSPRSRIRAFSGLVKTLCPAIVIAPETTLAVRSGKSLMMARPVVVFPAPVSPTSPMVRLASRERLTPLTAWTVSQQPPPSVCVQPTAC